jgi:hypothetical protein
MAGSDAKKNASGSWVRTVFISKYGAVKTKGLWTQKAKWG